MKKRVRNEGRPGYKKTRIGWIPEEWECVKFSDVSELVRGPFGGALKKEIFVLSGYKVYEQQHAIYGNFNAGEYFIDEEYYNRLKRFALQPGDIIMSCSGTAGRFAIFSPNAKPGIINQALLKIRSQRKTITITFLYYFLNSQFFQRNLFSGFAGGAIKNIAGMPTIKKIPIPLPPLPEQKKIAKILSAWDRAIEQVGRLVDAKQQLKKGLMQQLLTGRMRFSEFDHGIHGIHGKKKDELPEGWKEVQLRDIATILFSGVDKKSLPGQKKVRLCNYMDVYNNNYITADIDFMRATASDAEIEKFSLNIGDIMITKDSETPDDIGVPSVVTEKLDNVVCGYHLALIKPNREKIDPIYLAKQLGHERVANPVSRLANGATRFGLTTSSVKGVRLCYPKIEEQTRIAAAISTCDREIELLKKKQGKLKEQKKGLMQKLLTGKVRHPEFLKEGRA